MGRSAAAPVGKLFLLAVFLRMASMAASSESVAKGGGQTRPGMLEAPLDVEQLQRQAHEQGRGSSSSYTENNLLALDAQEAVHDGNKDAAADILMVLTKTTSAVTSTCSYTVTIKTSCSSPKLTRDAISLSFGDGDGNQVYAARLDDPSTGTFEQCSTDTFQIQGPCGGKTCYLYLRRSGFDGWAPDWVKVVPPYSGGQAVTFYYNAAALPADIWYGFNLCASDSGGGQAMRGAARFASWMVLVILLVVLQSPFL